MATHVDRRAAISPLTLFAIGLVGYAAIVAQFALWSKTDDSWWRVAIWATASLVCIAGVAAYGCIGKFLLRDATRKEFRSAFRPYFYGTALSVTTMLFPVLALLPLGL